MKRLLLAPACAVCLLTFAGCGATAEPPRATTVVTETTSAPAAEPAQKSELEEVKSEGEEQHEQEEKKQEEDNQERENENQELKEEGH